MNTDRSNINANQISNSESFLIPVSQGKLALGVRDLFVVLIMVKPLLGDAVLFNNSLSLDFFS
ncbi:MAG: hypothetical protein ACQ5SW_08595 [Sphaerochaetaceae bacterium]